MAKALEKFIEYVNKEEIPASEEEEKAFTNTQGALYKHKTKRSISWRLRFIIMRRDNFKCKNCGRSPATDSKIVLHVDHIISWSNGGETVPENLQTLCSICNIGKATCKYGMPKINYRLTTAQTPKDIEPKASFVLSRYVSLCHRKIKYEKT